MDQYELGEKLRDFYYNRLKFCGCGRPQDTMEFIRGFLNSIYDKFSKELSYYEQQDNLKHVFEFENKDKELTNTQYGVYQFIANYLDEIGILEHGGSIGGAWLSSEGKQLRDWLNSVEDYESIMD